MNHIFENLRIPTLLGLTVILLGLFASVYLTLNYQTIQSKAAPQITPKNILVTNVEDQSATITWQTDTAIPGFVTFGINSAGDQTALDDHDLAPTPRSTHHVTLKNLLPQTTYQFKITSGKLTSPIQQFISAPTSSANNLKPVIGSVLDDNKPLSGGLVFLQIDGALIQSAPIKNSGSFIIPLSQIRKFDLSSVFTPAIGTNAKLTIYTEDGKTGSATFNIKDNLKPIGPLKVGQDLDLRSASLGTSTSKFDLNNDGKINSGDYSIAVKKHFSQKDLNLLRQEFGDH